MLLRQRHELNFPQPMVTQSKGAVNDPKASPCAFRGAHVAPESFTKKAYKLDWILQ